MAGTGSFSDAAEVASSATPASSAQLPAQELTIVIPMLNERANVAPLLERLGITLSSIAWEVIFVDDDSVDGTEKEIRTYARRNGRVRCLLRIARRGLSSACIEGILASSAPYIAVMDGDLQHDERLLPEMLRTLCEERYDIVVGSRYLSGGGIGEWGAARAGASRLATRISRIVLRVDISDPLSGFFMMRREFFDGCVRRLSVLGFKILLDVLASASQPPRVKELPYTFQQRRYGESKLDTRVAWEFGMLFADKLVGHIVPVRFAVFALVGGVGVLVHFAMLAFLLKALGASFVVSQALATVSAMSFNFWVNNFLTYRDLRLKGWRAFKGLLSFYCVCSIGAVANVGIASYLFNSQQTWWVAGFAGVLIGSVWNYAVSSIVTWKSR
jgi:dolichol-phosphate mannosyltransferase